MVDWVWMVGIVDWTGCFTLDFSNWYCGSGIVDRVLWIGYCGSGIVD
jgi:hypothetical protein